MINIRKSKERGQSRMDWLESYHTFSFADYFDPNFVSFGALRVINEDIIEPARGFGRHPHKNMEIITYVIQGALEHKDSLGTGSVIRPGEIQRMSAGQGIHHSEYNHSPIEPLHLLQIWIHPEKENLTPSYEQKPIKKINNQLILIGSRHGDEHSVTIHQDVQLFLSYLNKDHSIAYDFKQKRQGWIQLIRGEIVVNGIRLIEGDGASLVQEKQVTIESVADAEFLFFDLNA